MHTYNIYTYTHTNIHTPDTYNFAYSILELVISSYHKSYQQYFDILLNCKKREIYSHKIKKINK